MYIADCDALATIADILNKQTEAKSLRERSSRTGTNCNHYGMSGPVCFSTKICIQANVV